MVNAADSATLDAPGFGPGATAPCTTNTLMCATAMYGAGTMTLVANIYGREVSSSAHAGVRYICPPYFPIEGVPDIGDLTFQRAAETNKATGIFEDEASVTLKGPWTKTKDLSQGFGGHYAEAMYNPTSGSDDLGCLVWVPAWLLHPNGSWAVFECKVWLDKNGDYFGSMLRTTHYNVDLYRPAQPPG